MHPANAGFLKQENTYEIAFGRIIHGELRGGASLIMFVLTMGSVVLYCFWAVIASHDGRIQWTFLGILFAAVFLGTLAVFPNKGYYMWPVGGIAAIVMFGYFSYEGKWKGRDFFW